MPNALPVITIKDKYLTEIFSKINPKRTLAKPAKIAHKDIIKAACVEEKPLWTI